MPAPTLVTEVETAWNSATSPKTTASISVQVGDVLVAYAAQENTSGTISTPTNSGTALTWTLRQSVDVADFCEVRVWTATATAAESITVSFGSSGGVWFGGAVQVWRDSDGVGASSAANADGAAPSVNITTTQANSAIAVCNGDWNASDGASRTWRANAGSLTETTYFRDSAHYSVYAGYHADAGAIGTYAVGLTAPAAQKYSIVAVEIKGSAESGNSGASQLGQLTSQGQSVRVGRLYFPAATAAPVGVSPDAGWNYTSERLERSFALIKGTSAIAIGTQVGPWTATAGQTALDRTYVSPPLAAQEISGTVSMQLMVREYAGTDNVDQVRLVIKVVSNDGGTVRATLYSGNGSTTAEFVNNVTHRNFTAANALALSSYTCVAGDRLAVEIGYRNSTAGTTPEASAKWGENAAVLPVNNTQTTDGAPWIDFSNGLEFAALTGTAEPSLGAPTSAASGAPVVTGSAAPQQGALTSEGSGSVGGSIEGSAADDLGSLASAAQGSPVGTGSAAPDLGAATSQASGSPAGTGSAADQLGTLASSATGTPVGTGTAAPDLGAATSAGQGSPVGTGESAAQLGDLTSGASGSTGSGVEGTAADQLGDLTSAAQGSPVGTGTAADQAGAATSEATGSPVVSGSATGQLGDAASAATGTPTVTGSAAAQAGAPTSEASGTPTVTGQGAGQAGDATSAAAGTPVVQGTAADQAGAATSAGAGAPVVTGIGAGALGDLTSQGQEGAISGSAADQLGSLDSAGQGSPVAAGTAAGQQGAATSSAAGTPVGTGAAAGQLGTLAGAAQGTPVVPGQASGTVDAITSSGQATPVIAGTAGSAAGAAASAGQGSPVGSGQAAGALGTLSGPGTGTPVITGNAFSDLGVLTSSGSEAQLPLRAAGIVTVPYEDRYPAIAAEIRIVQVFVAGSRYPSVALEIRVVQVTHEERTLQA